ncbi:ribonuclease-like [Emydura macquarii macquarii]|uniref:ribonuclease-like n=1 Tax=Emydura macquarii macquarii TaxID=1129001 RepID=UPI00352A191D
MALKGSCPALLLSLVLLGTWLTLASGQLAAPTNDRFLRRHWDFPKTMNGNNTAYCDLQTRSRGINGMNNTFIHARIAKINRICAKKRTGPVTSQQRFPLTVCRFNSTTQSYTGRSLTRRIMVVCKNRLPVRFRRFISRPRWE